MGHNSETGETMPTKIGMHACDINPYLQCTVLKMNLKLITINVPL